MMSNIRVLGLWIIAFILTTGLAKAAIPEWQPNTAYAVGAQVVYDSKNYQCIQAHTSEVGWQPPITPALWDAIGSVSPTPAPKTEPSSPSPTPKAQPQPPSPVPGSIHHYVGYYPTWSDNWFTAYNSDGSLKSDDQIYAESYLASTPGYFTDLNFAFAQPALSWQGLGANTWAGSGLQFNAAPRDIKEAIRVFKERTGRKTKVSVGGASYSSGWAQLAGEANEPLNQTTITKAFAALIEDLGLDGLEVDYEINWNNGDRTVAQEYYNVIHALRNAVDAAGGRAAGRFLTLAGWSTGADRTAVTNAVQGSGPVSYWAGNAGRERYVLQIMGAGQWLDMVSVMSYDAQNFHFDPVRAYYNYREILPSSLPLNIGLETAPEGWPGATLVLYNGDATVQSAQVLADQYGVTNPGPYSVERFVNAVKNSNNVQDGAMLWSIRKPTSGSANGKPFPDPTAVSQLVAQILGL
jgi:hypothetical protein